LPSGYACYKVDRNDDETGFPEGTKTIQQRALSLEGSNVQDEPTTEIRKKGIAANEDFEEFNVKHEREEEKWVRLDNEEYHQIIEIYEFPMYLHGSKERALFRTKKIIAKEVVSRFDTRSSNYLPVDAWRFDLEELTEELQEITGVWFSNLLLKNVSSAALFGRDVETSNEWNRYSNTGDLSNIHLEVEFKNSLFKCSISSKGSITIFNKMAESEKLELLDAVLDRIEEIEE